MMTLDNIALVILFVKNDIKYCLQLLYCLILIKGKTESAF